MVLRLVNMGLLGGIAQYMSGSITERLFVWLRGELDKAVFLNLRGGGLKFNRGLLLRCLCLGIALMLVGMWLGRSVLGSYQPRQEGMLFCQ